MNLHIKLYSTELDVGAYYPISIAPLLGFSKAPCQIFIQNETSYKSLVRSDDPMGDLLVELNQEEGVTLIVVTHSMDVARKMDRIFNIENGKLKESSGFRVASFES